MVIRRNNRNKYWLGLVLSLAASVFAQRTPMKFNNSIIENANLKDGTTVAYDISGANVTPRAVTPQMIDVRTKGAILDGVTDDSASISNAVKSLGALGGIVYIPGKSAFNIVLQNQQNVTMTGIGNVKDYAGGVPTYYWTPFNTNLPVIQVGNNTADVKGFTLQNATFYGGTGSTKPTLGLYFAGGAQEAHLENVTVWEFKECIKFLAGASFPCTKIFVHGFNLQPSDVVNARGIHVIMPANAISYTTAINFAQGNINGPSAAGSYAIEVDGTDLGLSQVYADVSLGHGVLFSQSNSGSSSPWIECFRFNLDGGNGVVAECAQGLQLIPQWANWFRGNASINGTLKLSDGSIQPKVGGTAGMSLIPYQSQANYLQVVGEAAFSDTGTVGAYNNSRRIEPGSANISLISDAGAVILKGSSGVILDAQNSGVLLRAIGAATQIVVSTELGTGSAPVSLGIAPTGNINLTAGTGGINLDGGSAHSVVLASADVYMPNNRGVLFKDSSGAYQYGLQPNGDDLAMKPKRHIILQPINNGGAVRFPPMTKAQRNALGGLVGGEVVYQTDSVIGLHEYRNGAWGTLGWVIDP